ncbi:zinc finger CCCH domain-containing protein 2 [Mangifera indica]|uniref:zinc finger CCCH domain-containing protein 2 n=1 Tax=Mangifera indica TaxID=29780 RepID=UPI001CFA665F|nr:zinc finger CCCH domain-containing protein 2 [Mangifera indica]XP_044465541.1 zinc finger CCCH domain-containing protein 2 [Mangifera indica]XP_044465543.1 zinc finger CCCH domain-containing protein 2 [Mangifera indica]XP_044465544.1 zinc finger CCCH domain-containing protein 2 [Mangifera indica]XP_044465545.1 zinc finger CCCH domain-containing protein 2 [Mangifera indica]XP_044465546.1 zinc finger CCCH domain-containing protein 2 [Mangifera indica]XP_044465547.1 zinc finger CCCH domain-co
MTTVCADQHQQKLQHLLSSKGSTKPFKNIEVPPRKLLLNSKKLMHHHHHQEINNMFFPEEISSLYKFLPFNNTDAGSDPDSDSDPYASDHFRMYEFKIRRCTRSRSHDWTDCPFAHPGEKARRRDPRRFHYSGTVCSEFRKGGGCSRGDDCEFAHGVFECWLHPSRYRTEACKDGKNCKRKVCFFAHSTRQLRILPEISSSPMNNHKNNHCCTLCNHSVNSSPTSTLLCMSHLSRSPSLSPPLSPVNHKFSPISRYTDCLTKFSSTSDAALSYNDMLNELMSSLDAMNFNEVSSPLSLPGGSSINYTVPWIDANSFNIDDQQQFVLSPSTPIPSGSMNPFGGDSSNKCLVDDQKINDINGGQLGCPDPDLGWVNELLM